MQDKATLLLAAQEAALKAIEEFWEASEEGTN